MTVKLEILYIVGTLERGGAERHLHDLAKALASNNRHIAVFPLLGGGAFAKSLLEANVPIFGLANDRQNRPRRWMRPIYFLINILILVAILLFRRPKIVHCFLPFSYLVGGTLSVLCNSSIRVMSRRSLNNYQIKKPLLAMYERHLHRYMARVLGNSEEVCNDLIKEGVPPEKIGLIYNGFDLERLRSLRSRSETRRQLNLSENTIVLTTVANLIPYKGHGDLMDALCQLDENCSSDWVLLVVGRDDGIGYSLLQMVAENGLEKHVLFLGERPDVMDLWAASDIGLLASHEEGFSNAVLESMSVGIPMIATDVGGNSEAVVHNVTGKICPSHEPKKLALAISELLLNATFRQSMGIAAKKRLKQHFTLTGMVAAYERTYEVLSAKM